MLEHIFSSPIFEHSAVKAVEEITVGIVVAILGGIAGFFISRIGEAVRWIRFRAVFGKAITKADDIVLSVPLWLALPKSRDTARFQKSGLNQAQQQLYGPDQMFNRQDMIAAAHILSVLNNHFESEVHYSNDTAGTNWDQKTLILVGSPISNLHAVRYLESHMAKRPQDNFPYFKTMTEDETTGARGYIHDPSIGTDLRLDEKIDYGIVLRLPNIYSRSSNHYVFLVAGIDEWSTREAGRLFAEHWREIGQRKFGSALLGWLMFWKWRDRPPPTGFIFQMDCVAKDRREEGCGTGFIYRPF